MATSYIGNLSKRALIKYLEDTNYAEVANILRNQNIDGKQFINISAYNLVSWNLDIKERKLLLKCKEEILASQPVNIIKQTESNNVMQELNNKLSEVRAKLNKKNSLNSKNTENLYLEPKFLVPVTPSHSETLRYVNIDQPFQVRNSAQSQANFVTELESDYVPCSNESGNPSEKCIYCGQVGKNKSNTLLEELHNSPYYRKLDREGAIRLLKTIPDLSDGVFLLRPSTGKCFFALTIYKEGNFHNMMVEKDPDERLFNIQTQEGKKIKFKRLETFIEYYTINGLTIQLKEHCLEVYLKEILLPDNVL